MANMSYCMWENTNSDLVQLYNDIGEAMDEENPSFNEWLASKNSDERAAVARVIQNCRELIEQYEQFKEYE